MTLGNWTHSGTRPWCGLGAAAAILCMVAAVPALAVEGGEPDPRWQQLQEHYFPDATIQEAPDLVHLEAPKRAQDAALVPMGVELDQSVRAKAVHLIIDNNPVPLAATFTFGDAYTPGPIETRVRVDRYTNVHAVVETEDGRMLMTKRYVKASGGCSAPAVRDPEQAAAQLGKMKLNLPDQISAGQPVTAQLLIRHPNNSGLQFDQITRFYIPPHYLETIDVTYNGIPVMNIDADISISEDPSFRFSFIPQESGTLEVTARDSKDMEFTESWTVHVAPAL